MFKFAISSWHAWAPSMPNKEAWERWAEAPFSPIGTVDCSPKLDFLPPIQRRRLGSLARMVFECAWPLAEESSPMPVVYASRHGETTRGFDLLSTLAKDEGLSPASFGLSVHNAIIGQWSIIRGETTEAVAISTEGGLAEHAFIEACALQAQGHDSVLVILAEERPPKPYLPWIQDAPFSHAAAFRVQRGDNWTLTMDPAMASSEIEPLPSSLNLLRHLCLDSTTWCHHTSRQEWTWTRRN